MVSQLAGQHSRAMPCQADGPNWAGCCAHFAATSPAAAPATQVRGESAAQDLVAVLGVLEGAPDLRDLLQRVEREFNKYAGEWWQP